MLPGRPSLAPIILRWITRLRTDNLLDVSDFLSTGGYVVPLGTTGEVYVVFKSRDSRNDTNPLYGRKCTWTGTAVDCLSNPRQTIDGQTGQGVYTYGTSAVEVNGEVHVVYVDCVGDSNCGAPTTTQLKYFCREMDGTPRPGVNMINATAIYHNPSLTWDDDTTEELYAFFRTDRKLEGPNPPAPTKHSASSAIYYRKGADPTGGTYRYDFPSPDTPVVTNIWGLWAPVDTPASAYPLFTNYSTPGGASGARKIIAAWTEGIYGMDATAINNP